VIRVVRTSRGLLVFAIPGSWGDWYELALLDDELKEIAADEDELHEENDVRSSLVGIGIPHDEAAELAASLVPAPRERSKRRARLAWRRNR
jgi:hypothetical protein